MRGFLLDGKLKALPVPAVCMFSPQRILVVVDPETESSPACTRAASLAHLAAASLHLCMFVYDPLLARPDLPEQLLLHARSDFLRRPEQRLAERAQALREQGLEVSAEIVWAPVLHESLIGKVLEHHADLVIKDAAQDSGLPRWRHSPTDWKVLRYCPAPLMLVAPWSKVHPWRIAAAVDAFQPKAGSALNESIIRTAQAIGALCSAEVHVVSSFPWKIAPDARELANVHLQARQEHAAALAALCADMGVDAGRTHQLEGTPLQSLPDYLARSKSDLLVLGSMYRQGLSRLLLGNTAEELLGGVACDLLLIKPEGFLKELDRHLDIRNLQRRYRIRRPRTGDPA